MTITNAIRDLKQDIHDTAVDHDRHSDPIRLVLVTKTVSPEKILEAYQTGERDFGENRVQEWQEKRGRLPSDIRWHLIGHLQTNKVKYAVGQVHLIHSLDRIELADEIENQARKKSIGEVPCLIQVNMSGEGTKYGVDPFEIEKLSAEIVKRSSIKIKGLMTIGPFTHDLIKIRDCFKKTRELLETLKAGHTAHSWDILSMGMSGDYKIAIEEGSNLLRIGSLVFGKR